MKHDESKDLVAISKVVRVDNYNKTLQAPKSAIIGIKTWGRIDYLVNYCGWHFFWNNDAVAKSISKTDTDSYKTRKREAKKFAKENTLTNKKHK